MLKNYNVAIDEAIEIIVQAEFDVVNSGASYRNSLALDFLRRVKRYLRVFGE